MSPSSHQDMTHALWYVMTGRPFGSKVAAEIGFINKEFERVARQNDAWRTEDIADFLKGEYKPGLESHERKRA